MPKADPTANRVLVSRGGHGPARQRMVELFDTIVASRQDVLAMDADQRAAIAAFGCMSDPVDATLLDALPNLKIVSSFGVGYDHVDAGYAADKGVIVTHTPGVLDEEVADTALGLLLNTVRELPKAEAYLRAGRWVAEGAYPITGLTLRDRTAGIFGLGRIGLAIARRLEAFGLAIHYHNRSRKDAVPYPYHETLASLADACDTLICVAPGTAETHHAVNADVLGRLGAKGVVINIGRGSVVDESALIDALRAGTIAAAGLDVFEDEPHVPEALLNAPNASLLPHVGSASHHTRDAMGDLVVDNLLAWFKTGRALTPIPETRHLQE